MFDLEKAVAEWRKEMLAAGIGMPAPLEELESHLREEIERQVKSGVSEPIAFEQAVGQIGQPQSLRNEFRKAETNTMKYQSSRFFGLSVVAGIVLSFILAATVELLRPDYSPLRNLLNEYLVGPFGFLERAAACMLAATFLIALVGLRRSVRPSAFLTASCVLLGVVVISLGLSAAFPSDQSPDGSRPIGIGVAITHLLSAVRIYALLIALVWTLPSAYRRDEQWRPLSHLTLFLGLLILALGIGIMLAPFDLRGLVQRTAGLVIGAWLLLTALHFRQATPSAHGTAAP